MEQKKSTPPLARFREMQCRRTGVENRNGFWKEKEGCGGMVLPPLSTMIAEFSSFFPCLSLLQKNNCLVQQRCWNIKWHFSEELLREVETSSREYFSLPSILSPAFIQNGRRGEI